MTLVSSLLFCLAAGAAHSVIITRSGVASQPFSKESDKTVVDFL
jgi:hypothetical protein